MKYLVISLLFISVQAWAACNQKVNSKKVVVFVDTNNSTTEVKAAEAAACARGESFVKLPKTGSAVSKTDLINELNAMAGADKSLTSLIVSGHDGGGSVHGSGAFVGNRLDKWEAINAFNEAYKSKPQLKNDFKSVYMWGCWSMGPSEVEVWRKEIPSLKVAAGFMDMGPKNTTAACHTVLKGLMLKEKSLYAEADKNKLKRAIASVEHINMTYASVYTEAACGNQYWYRTDGDAYENKYDGSDYFTPGQHFLDFDKSFSCDSMKSQIDDYQKELQPYFYGDKELPADGPNSPIKKLYTFFRKAAHCIPKTHMANPDRMVLLRFYNAVKENFSAVFENEIRAAHEEMQNLEKTLSGSSLSADMKKFKETFLAGKKNYLAINGKNLIPRSRKEIRDMIGYLDSLLKQDAARNNRSFADKLRSIRKLNNAMEKYLYQMEPACMDFLSWHEVEPGVKPQAKCSI